MSTLDLIPVSSYKINNIEKRVRRKRIMTSEEIKNMSFEDFRTQIEGMEEVQKLTADGTERYGIYKHDVCYVNRDECQSTKDISGNFVCSGIGMEKTGQL